MFEIRIATSGAAFTDLPQMEVSRILGLLKDRVANGMEDDGGVIFDHNGNRVGKWKLAAGADAEAGDGRLFPDVV